LRVLERMSPNERELLVAHWFTPSTGDITVASIAAKSGCSVFTMRRRLSRAQARFKKLARRDPVLAQCLGEARRTELPKATGEPENDPEI